MAAATVERFGGIDLLVNNAAIYGGMEIDLLLTVDWDYYRRFMSVNMDGALRVTRACYGAHAARGGGAIVNQSSTAAWLYSGFYGLAKVRDQRAHPAARPRARRHRTSGSTPSPPGRPTPRRPATSCPAIMDELVEGAGDQAAGHTDDLVGACLFLLSDEASWVTGQILNVDGGQVFRS
jgi:3-oxoacyl-[acyl-carrier protein] reductase